MFCTNEKALSLQTKCILLVSFACLRSWFEMYPRLEQPLRFHPPSTTLHNTVTMVALSLLRSSTTTSHKSLHHLCLPLINHQRRGNVAEGVDNNVGRFHQNCQNFRHHVRNFLWPNLRIVLERNFFFRKTKIVPEMFFLLFLLNINVAVQPFIGPPLALYLPCSITGACSPPSCHLTFVF